MPDKTTDELLDGLLAGVTEANTMDESLIALTGRIKAALDDALKGVTLTSAQREKFNRVFTVLSDGKARVSEAVVANTPAE